MNIAAINNADEGLDIRSKINSLIDLNNNFDSDPALRSSGGTVNGALSFDGGYLKSPDNRINVSLSNHFAVCVDNDEDQNNLFDFSANLLQFSIASTDGRSARVDVNDGAWLMSARNGVTVKSTVSVDQNTVRMYSGGNYIDVLVDGTDMEISSSEVLSLLAHYLNVSAETTFLNTVTLNADPAQPMQAATKQYADALVVGLLDDRGSYNASSNVYPSAGGSGAAGVIKKGDLWYISVAGTLGGVPVSVGSSVRALTDSPGQTSTNWDILSVGLGYVPENIANRTTAITIPNNTTYPTTQAVTNYVNGRGFLTSSSIPLSSTRIAVGNGSNIMSGVPELTFVESSSALSVLQVASNDGNGEVQIISDSGGGGVAIFSGSGAILQLSLNDVTQEACLQSMASLGIAITPDGALRLDTLTAPAAPADGVIWFDGSDYKATVGGVVKTINLI